MIYSSRFSGDRQLALLQLSRETLAHPDVLRVDLREDAARAAQSVRNITNSRGVESALNELSRCYYLSGEQQVLTRLGLPILGYNPSFDLGANASGPWMPQPDTRPVSYGHKWRVLGFDLGLPIGLPASVLTLNSKYVQFYASSGFNIITYKTVRARAHAPHEPPHWLFLEDAQSPWDIGNVPASVTADLRFWPSDNSRYSTANSFGVPSAAPEEWQPDVKKALTYLADDQLMILSIMGGSDTDADTESVVRDFVEVARLGAETGVNVIELNLSCPNVLNPTTGQVEGNLICHNAELSQRIVRSCREIIDSNIRLVAKVSWMTFSHLRDAFGELLQSGTLDGIAGVNTIQTQVLDSSLNPSFPNREIAGVSGAAIRNYSQDFLKSCTDLREAIGYFDILYSGGVITPFHAFEALRNGATAAMSATGAFVNPDLAAECVDLFESNDFVQWPTNDEAIEFRFIDLPEAPSVSTERILKELDATGGTQTIEELQRLLNISLDEIRQLIASGESLGLIRASARRGVVSLSLSDTAREVLKVS
jgi:dihydroorotate dehydrogenase